MGWEDGKLGGEVFGWILGGLGGSWDVLGGLWEGLGRFWTDRSVDLIKIPMKGSADSLNLHASAACILAEYNRRGGS